MPVLIGSGYLFHKGLNPDIDEIRQSDFYGGYCNRYFQNALTIIFAAIFNDFLGIAFEILNFFIFDSPSPIYYPTLTLITLLESLILTIPYALF